MEPAEHPQQAPAHVHTDELPPWLAPGANPVPPGPLSKPAVAWGGTLTATALMVAFGLWLGDVPAPPSVAAVRKVPAAAPPLVADRPAPDVPPMVLAEPVAAPAPAVRARPVAIIKRPAAASRRTVLASARPARTHARLMPTSLGSNRMASMDSGVGQRITCKHGELARECLARYR